MKGSKQRIAARMTEDELLEQVRTLCRGLRLLHYHTYDSRGSEPGYPDWHIVGPGGSIFRELKTERGRLTDDQEKWLDALRSSGHDADVWRPSDLLVTGRIRDELRELSKIKVRGKRVG